MYMKLKISHRMYYFLSFILLSLVFIGLANQISFIPMDWYINFINIFSLSVAVYFTYISSNILCKTQDKLIAYFKIIAHTIIYTFLIIFIMYRTIPFLTQSMLITPAIQFHKVVSKDYTSSYRSRIFTCTYSLYLIQKSLGVSNGGICVDKVDWYGVDYGSEIKVIGNKNIIGFYIKNYHLKPKTDNFTYGYINLLLQHLSQKEQQEWIMRSSLYQQKF